MAQNNDSNNKLHDLRKIIDEGENSGLPVDVGAESFLAMSRKDRLEALRAELVKGEESGFVEISTDLDAINAEIDKLL